MKKQIGSLLFGLILVGTLTGCGKNEENNDNPSNPNQTTPAIKEEAKGNCTVLECIKLIDPKNTVAEIDEIIGIKGELTEAQYNKYYWKLSEDTGITVTYYSSPTGTIKIDAEKDSYKDSQVDLSQMETIKAKINDGLTYDQIKAYVGGAEGVLTEKSSSSLSYTWVNSNGGYLNTSFSVSKGTCTYMFGVAK